jgi:hypothetical protein
MQNEKNENRQTPRNGKTGVKYQPSKANTSSFRCFKSP